LLKAEKACAELAGTPEVAMATAAIIEHVNALREKKSDTEAGQEATPKRKRRKPFFSTMYGKVLTDTENIAFIRLENDFAKLRELKVPQLQQWILKDGNFAPESIYSDQSRSKFVKRADLLELVEARFRTDHARLMEQIQLRIDRYRKEMPPTEDLMAVEAEEAVEEAHGEPPCRSGRRSTPPLLMDL
jgi:uncharacterized protein YnzC (UPF0291/DUF896 family)